MALEIIEFTCTIVVIGGFVSQESIMTTFHIWKGCLIFGFKMQNVFVWTSLLVVNQLKIERYNIFQVYDELSI